MDAKYNSEGSNNSSTMEEFITETLLESNATEARLNMSAVASGTSEFEGYLEILEPSVVSLFLFFSVVAVAMNLYVFSSVWRCPARKSPNLLFSISLALADAVSSIAIGLDWLIYSLIKYEPENLCFYATLQALR